MAELKKLIPGDTLLAVIRKGVLVEGGKPTGSPGEYLLFYGNVVVMPETEKRYHAAEDVYLSMLEEFFESDEGKRYERPSEEQIKADIAACITPPTLPPIESQTLPPVEEDSLIAEEDPLYDSDSKSLPSDSEEEEEVEEEIDEDEEEDESEAEEEHPVKKKRLRGFPLFQKKKELAKEDLIEEEQDPDTTDRFIESLVEEEVPAQKFQTISEDATQISSLKKEIKHLKVIAVLLVAAALIPLMLYALDVITVSRTDTKDVSVISLTKDIKAGEVIPIDALMESIVPRAEFNNLSSGTAVDPSGNVVQDYMQLWSNRNQISGKYATADLKEGDYLYASDYTVLKKGVNMIELDIDGTKVKVPISATSAGSSDVRLYAIVTTRSTDDQISSFAVNLGELKFNGKTLKNILDSSGKSVLQDLLGN